MFSRGEDRSRWAHPHFPSRKCFTRRGLVKFVSDFASSRSFISPFALVILFVGPLLFRSFCLVCQWHRVLARPFFLHPSPASPRSLRPRDVPPMYMTTEQKSMPPDPLQHPGAKENPQDTLHIGHAKDGHRATFKHVTRPTFIARLPFLH